MPAVAHPKPLTLGSVIKTRKQNIEATKERLVKTLLSTVLEKIEVPIEVHDIGDKIDLENEIVEILLTYKFNRSQVYDLTELLFHERVNHLTLEDDVIMDNQFGQAYHDFVRYYLAGYVADHMVGEV